MILIFSETSLRIVSGKTTNIKENYTLMFSADYPKSSRKASARKHFAFRGRITTEFASESRFTKRDTINAELQENISFHVS